MLHAWGVDLRQRRNAKHTRRKHKTLIRTGLDVFRFVCFAPLAAVRPASRLRGDVLVSENSNSPCVSVSLWLRGETSSPNPLRVGPLAAPANKEPDVVSRYLGVSRSRESGAHAAGSETLTVVPSPGVL